MESSLPQVYIEHKDILEKRMYHSDILPLIDECWENPDNLEFREALKQGFEEYSKYCYEERDRKAQEGSNTSLVTLEAQLKIASLALSFYKWEADALDQIYQAYQGIPLDETGDELRYQIRDILV